MCIGQDCTPIVQLTDEMFNEILHIGHDTVIVYIRCISFDYGKFRIMGSIDPFVPKYFSDFVNTWGASNKDFL
ncbi:Uncharacterised protein [Chlamydia abortus]|nr:Uncharacterised protein [Chlamydia abortus]